MVEKQEKKTSKQLQRNDRIDEDSSKTLWNTLTHVSTNQDAIIVRENVSLCHQYLLTESYVDAVYSLTAWRT